MSRDNVEGVRTPVTISGENTRRTMDERFFVRFPILARVVVLAWSRLPPRSRLRRALTAHLWRSGIEAANRRDFDVVLLALDPAIEYEMGESLAGLYVPPDLVGIHRGHEAFLRVWERLFEAWEDLRVEPEEIIDFGDRLLAAGRVTAHARQSGITLDSPLFQLVTIRRGLFARQKDFIDRDKAFEAAGLQE